MKILITGGAGFIGSHLCDALIQDTGNHISVLDNLSLGRLANIEHLFGNARFKFFEGDILDEVFVSDVFTNSNFDIVFHLAANSDIAISHTKPAVDVNNTFLTTYKILEMMRVHGVFKIVFASTSAIYGDPAGSKLTENFGPLLPVSHYGASKLASEAVISSYVANYKIQAWIVRFPNVVGERATHGAIFDFIRKAYNNPIFLEVLGNGEQNKPYVYVRDLVEAILFVWSNTSDPINIFNIGVDSRTKVKEMAQIVLEESGLDREIRYTGGSRGWVGDVPEFEYDLTKIHNLGWKAKHSSTEAVRKAVQQILLLTPQIITL
ncbi:NAD-dependent epimerase/dehydratase family protein [Dyadobacter sp. CY345]|uniref:NAD-dependent epimerase/dehydratase family protein n=1 Tax=Dyadobacter sp. CY345 TaxID=2909335 RepID=UPI001F232CFE|nr:NAD-dependent epimerase/dehydratase family protein [Dyadobacter sp. CY345]MCF2444414.1 NAD-dependent epimerase/dehydratase family protein [Dyadobacter sp. CY345]